MDRATFIWKTGLYTAAVLTIGVAHARAEPAYDRTVEKAALTILASKMGDLRGGFSPQQAPVLVVSESKAARRIAETAQMDGMRIARPKGGVVMVEARVSASSIISR